MKTKIYFRVDANMGMGKGHLIRSLALANMLKKDFQCIFLSKIDDFRDIDRIQNEGIHIIPMPCNHSLIEEAYWLNSKIINGDEIIVLDGYQFNKKYQSILISKAGKLVCIDDTFNNHYWADLVINHAGGIKANQYHISKYSTLCLGLDYLLLRKEFFNNIQKIKQAKLPKNIMICLGGEDPNNDTLKVLKKCESISSIQKCKVIIGNGYLYKETLNKYCKKSILDIDILHDISAQKMAEIMQESDTAICSPSTTSLEYLSIGGNLFLQQTADNQKYIYKYLINNKLAFSIQEIKNVSKNQLTQALSQQHQLIDGKSQTRLLMIFKYLNKQLEFKLRKANRKDMFQYFIWTNDTATRQQSFNSKNIGFIEHHIWYHKNLEDDNVVLYIMENQGRPVGQIRFEIENEKANISYSLDENFRGKGLGKILIKEGIKNLLIEQPKVETITGHVKLNNLPSINTFKKIGFQEILKESTTVMFYQNF